MAFITGDTLEFPASTPGSGNSVYNFGANANDIVSNTSAATPFSTTATIPAGDLQAGDIIHVRAIAAVTGQNSTNTNNFQLQISTVPGTFTLLTSTGAASMAASTPVIIDGDFIFTGVGTSGTGIFVGGGLQGSASQTPFYFASTAICTTAAITVRLVDTQNVANSGNTAQLFDFEVTRKRK